MKIKNVGIENFILKRKKEVLEINYEDIKLKLMCGGIVIVLFVCRVFRLRYF